MNRESDFVEPHTEFAERKNQDDVSVSLDEVIGKSIPEPEYGPLFGVYTLPLLFDKEHNVFCIHHPFQQGYVIPVVKTTVSVYRSDIEKEVLISFVGGDIYQPIINGKVRSLGAESGEVDLSEAPVNIGADDQEKLVFKAEKEIVLQCGKSSIHLTKAGKVLIKGAYLLSRSSGVNKIKGGSIQLN